MYDSIKFPWVENIQREQMITGRFFAEEFRRVLVNAQPVDVRQISLGERFYSSVDDQAEDGTKQAGAIRILSLLGRAWIWRQARTNACERLCLLAQDYVRELCGDRGFITAWDIVDTDMLKVVSALSGSADPAQPLTSRVSN